MYICRTKNEGFLAQLVQSIWFTPRGSGVRIPQDPLQTKISQKCEIFLFHFFKQQS